MRPRYPVEVVVKDPVRRDNDGRPRLVFLWLASEEDLRSLEDDVASGKYNVLNGIEPAMLVEDIAMARRKRKRKPAQDAAGTNDDVGMDDTSTDEYEDVLDDDEEQGEPEGESGVPPSSDAAQTERTEGDTCAEHQENCPQ